jgi:hypothetical protein
VNAKLALADAVSPLGPDVIAGATGAIESTSHVYDVGELVCVTVFARTWNVCDPCPTVYAFDPDVPGPAQFVNVGVSKAHWNVTDCECVNVKLAAVVVDGFEGFTVIVGAAKGGAANATNAK